MTKYTMRINWSIRLFGMSFSYDQTVKKVVLLSSYSQGNENLVLVGVNNI